MKNNFFFKFFLILIFSFIFLQVDLYADEKTKLTRVPSINDSLSSWYGSTINKAIDTWGILPDKDFVVDNKTKKYEFNYSRQMQKSGAYIPGEDRTLLIGNNWVTMGQEEGSYQQIVVNYSCKVIVTCVNGVITACTYSGDKEALSFFDMEPTHKAEYDLKYKEQEEEEAAIAKENEQNSYKNATKYFFTANVNVFRNTFIASEFSPPANQFALTIDFSLPKLATIYPTFEFIYAFPTYKEKVYGGSILATINAYEGGEMLMEPNDSDAYLGGGISLYNLNSKPDFGFIILAGIRLIRLDIHLSTSYFLKDGLKINTGVGISFGF